MCTKVSTLLALIHVCQLQTILHHKSMNRYSSSGPSKATTTTLCQKCLKRGRVPKKSETSHMLINTGHFSYECTASNQDRPYVSRPSRTQPLLNPKLAPKITEAPLKSPVAATTTPAGTKTLASSPRAHLKRPRDDINEESERVPHSVRSRSASYSLDSDSVSTISTDASRSRSPPRRASRPEPEKHVRQRSSHHSPQPLVRRRARSRSSSSRSRSRSRDGQRARRPLQHTAERTRSRSPYHGPEERVQRQRSLSPYSRRLALSGAVRQGS